MKSRAAFSLALTVVCLLPIATVVFAAAAVWADLAEDGKHLLKELLAPRLGLVVLVLAAACLVAGLLLKWAWRTNVEAPRRLAEQLRLMLDANPDYRLPALGGAQLRPLIAAANELADRRDALRRDVEEQIKLAKTSVEAEKNRLAALMSELNQSVVVCNLDGRILLYNNRARLEFRAFVENESASGSLLGLGRSIFSVFDRHLIAHALDSLQRRLDTKGSQPVAHFVTATSAGQLIRVQMAPVLSATVMEGDSGESDEETIGHAAYGIGGYVLLLENITRIVETETRRDQVLQHLTEGSRATLANIRAAVETLLHYPDIEVEQRDRFLHIIGDEVRGMGQRLDRTLDGYADSLKARWPLEEMLATDLVAAAQRRIEAKLGLTVKIDAIDPELWIKVDSFSLIQAMSYLAGRLQEVFDIPLLRIRLTQGERMAHLDLAWTGAAASSETLHGWELEPMNLSGETSPLTLRDIIDRHGGEIWFQRESAAQQAYFRLLIPLATPRKAVEPSTLMRGGSRPEYYDFDLFKRSGQNHALDERLLADLTYTAFDTETTGLDPSAGDEIIQFGAVRIVNGRLLRHENFEQLVDPRRRLRAESIAIHGITAEMLAGQPTVERVLPTFHQFGADTVLVAHNAAFDMRFLQLKEESTGIRFTQPVLDTLLLSAVIHPNQESHKLEAIAERLGITIIGRHTALGDAIVTGEVFLRMIPLLDAMDIRTLGDALLASRQTYYARIKY